MFHLTDGFTTDLPFDFGGTGMGMSMAVTALMTVSAPAIAQTTPSPDAALNTSVPVVVIVRVPKPWYAPKAIVVGKMRDTMPEYASLNGLAFKAFSFERQSGDYGGVYYWRDASSAKMWFNPAWFERVKKERGSDAQLRYFDALVSVDNTPGGTPINADSTAVVTLVEIPVPAGISRDRLNAEFVAALPVYQKIPGLLRKHFTASSGGNGNGNASNTFGGVYIWKDEASAKNWFNAAWHERVVKSYGQDAKIEWFDAPVLLPTQNAGNMPRAGAMVVAP